MFRYTITAIKMIINYIKKIANIIKWVSLIFSIFYYLFVLIMGIGNLIINIILTVLFVTYTLYEFISFKKKNYKVKRILKRVYNWLKIGIKTFTLGSSIYGIYIASSNVSGISIILATLMIILWILQIGLELVIFLFEDKIRLIIAGFYKDFEFVRKIGNFFSKDKEKDEEDYSSEIQILSKQIEKEKLEKQSKKINKNFVNVK